MIAVVDYGMGNVRSAQKGMEKAGYAAVITDDPGRITEADGVVLPGVGAFGDCYRGLEGRGLVDTVVNVVRSGKPFLGICVGLQLLFEGSEEDDCRGLGLLPGRVVRFPDPERSGLKVPHMGWNPIRPTADRTCPLLSGLPVNDRGEGPHMYFVHSYYAVPSDPGMVWATCEYGVEFAAVVGRENLFAVQFHPEKSQHDGITLLKAFGALARRHAELARTG